MRVVFTIRRPNVGHHPLNLPVFIFLHRFIPARSPWFLWRNESQRDQRYSSTIFAFPPGYAFVLATVFTLETQVPRQISRSEYRRLSAIKTYSFRRRVLINFVSTIVSASVLWNACATTFFSPPTTNLLCSAVRPVFYKNTVRCFNWISIFYFAVTFRTKLEDEGVGTKHGAVVINFTRGEDLISCSGAYNIMDKRN